MDDRAFRGIILRNDMTLLVPFSQSMMDSKKAEGCTVTSSDMARATVSTDGKSILIEPHRDGHLRVQLMGRNGHDLGEPLDIDIVDFDYEPSFNIGGMVYAPKEDAEKVRREAEQKELARKEQERVAAEKLAAQKKADAASNAG
jgi:hypothetical protein